MITLERMLFLKTVELFKYTKDDILLAVAAVLEEQFVEPGECIINKGDLGDTMYMIITGKVRVHDGEKLLTTLGEREIFGELAALCPDKRTASVTAIEETLLLPISHTTIYDLMDLHIGLAKGIIHVLCQKTRNYAQTNSKN